MMYETATIDIRKTLEHQAVPLFHQGDPRVQGLMHDRFSGALKLLCQAIEAPDPPDDGHSIERQQAGLMG